MRAAEERGLEIPRDLSIVGFDDVEKTQIVTPALTTVRQPLAEMGRMAVSLLTRLLEDQPIEAMRVELATKLVVRESTAPPRRRPKPVSRLGCDRVLVCVVEAERPGDGLPRGEGVWRDAEEVAPVAAVGVRCRVDDLDDGE